MGFEFVQHICVDTQSHLCFIASAQRPSNGEWRRSAAADVVQAWRQGRACGGCRGERLLRYARNDGSSQRRIG